jgi:hypothetical protein
MAERLKASSPDPGAVDSIPEVQVLLNNIKQKID